MICFTVGLGGPMGVSLGPPEAVGLGLEDPDGPPFFPLPPSLVELVKTMKSPSDGGCAFPFFPLLAAGAGALLFSLPFLAMSGSFRAEGRFRLPFGWGASLSGHFGEDVVQALEPFEKGMKILFVSTSRV